MRRWAGVLLLGGVAWIGLATLDEPATTPSGGGGVPGFRSSPADPVGDPPSGSSGEVAQSATPTTVAAEPDAAQERRRVEAGRAVAAAVGYLDTIAQLDDEAARRAMVVDLVVPEAAAAPPLVSPLPFRRVTGPGRVVAIDWTAAAVAVPTDTGPVILELRPVAGAWLVAGTPDH